MSLDPLTFRRAAGLFATGVTVVTTRVDGIDHAMTANSFTSVSLDPVLVLVSVDKTTRWHAAVAEAQVFGVSVLNADQSATSKLFATRGRPLDARTVGIDVHEGRTTGVLLLSGALATFECTVFDTHSAGDHTLVIGAVLAVDVPAQQGAPLVFYSGAYRSLT